MNELKRCPFCGGPAYFRAGITTVIGCPYCIVGTHTYAREQDAIAAWNARADDWLPIETAPKDGAAILIFCPDKESHEDWRGHIFDDPRYAIGYWRTWYKKPCFGNRNDAHVSPTHWMPLPTPPEESK